MNIKKNVSRNHNAMVMTVELEKTISIHASYVFGIRRVERKMADVLLQLWVDWEHMHGMYKILTTNWNVFNKLLAHWLTYSV